MLFYTEDRSPLFLRSGIVYKFQSGGWLAEMLPIIAKPNIILWPECVNTWEFWALIDKRVLFCNHFPDFDNSSILTTNNDFKVTLMESFLFHRDHPALNKSKQSLPLELYDTYRIKFHLLWDVRLILLILSFITWILYSADFNLAACEFVRFHLIIILKQNLNISLII